MGNLAHGGQMVLGVLNVLETLRVVRLDTTLDESLERLLVLIPLLNLGLHDKLRMLGRRCNRLRRRLGGRLARAGLLLSGLLLLGLILPLPAPGGGGGAGGRRGSWRNRGTVIIVYTPHVVSQVPLPRKAMTCHGALTALICAEIRLLAVAVHGMSLTLMPEEAGSGRESGVLAALHLAPVGL